MNIKKYRAVIAIVTISLIGILTIQFLNNKKVPKLSGVGIALDNFFMARAWPDSMIAHNQYEEAYKRHQQMQ